MTGRDGLSLEMKKRKHKIKKSNKRRIRITGKTN